MSDIKSQDNGPLYYNGEEIDDMSLSLLENALESCNETIKDNKQRKNITHNKNRKE